MSRLPIVSTDDKVTYVFASFNVWQFEKPQKYSSMLFIDSKHNTCYAIYGYTKEGFLNTIIIKDDVTDSRVPIIFILLNSETRWPLAEPLIWLKGVVGLSERPNIMIDCSPDEAVTILLVFQILY